MKPRGFTLIEIIIYIALMAVFFVAVIRFMLAFLAAEQKAAVMTEVEEVATIAIERMVAEIRSSDGIDTANSVFGTNPGVLTLYDDVPANDPTVFDVDNGILRIKQGSGTAYALTSGLTVTNFIVHDRSVSGKTQNVRIHLSVEWASADSVEYQTDFVLAANAVVRAHED